jgi:hypothetical protein
MEDWKKSRFVAFSLSDQFLFRSHQFFQILFTGSFASTI